MQGDADRERGDALRVPLHEEALGLHRTDDGVRDIDGEQLERHAIALHDLQLAGRIRECRLLGAAMLDDARAPRECVDDLAMEVRELDGLHQIGGRAARERRARGDRVVHGRQHHDREIGLLRERGDNELQPRHPRHADVAHHRLEVLMPHRLERRRAGGDGHRVKAAKLEEARERRADGRLVIDDDDASDRGRFDGVRRDRGNLIGHQLQRHARLSSICNVRRKVAPAPGALCTVSMPPCVWTMPKLTLRPSPVPAPSGFVVKNGSNIRFCTSTDMP